MMRTATRAVSAALAACMVPASTSCGQQAATEVNIAAMPVGQPPAGFDVERTGKGEPGQWVVVADATAAGGRAIAQISRDQTDYRFPLAIYRQAAPIRNVEVAVRCKPVSGTVDRACGIALRLTTPNDYYVLRANALEDNVNLYRVVKGRREQFAGVSTKVTANAWHTLDLRAEGDRFTVSFDGKQLYMATDKTFSDAGRVALWTKADSVTYFDRIAIIKLP